MSTSVTDRVGARGRVRVPTPRSAGGAPVVPAQRQASEARLEWAPRNAAVRAYTRRDERVRRREGRSSAAGRPRFVLLMMTLLGSGLVASLWLSTAAAADSYLLEDARAAAQGMTEQSERLHREVATLSSPTSLAERASGLGMVPVQDSARLVVGTRGDVEVVGTPRAAVAPPPPTPPLPPGCLPVAAAAPGGAAPVAAAAPGGAAPVAAAAPGGAAPVAAAAPGGAAAPALPVDCPAFAVAGAESAPAADGAARADVPAAPAARAAPAAGGAAAADGPAAAGAASATRAAGAG